MFIIIAGGGKLGFNLLKNQLQKSNEVVIIEKNRQKCSFITEKLGNLAIPGDASDPSVLEMAGIVRADMVIACTGNDPDNLVICQLASKKYKVPYTIAIVSNPANEQIFKKMGVDNVVNSIDSVLISIEQRIAHFGMMTIVSREDEIEIVETLIPIDSPAVGRTIGQIPFPSDCIVTAIIREGKLLKADNDLRLKIADIVITVIYEEKFRDLKTALLGFDSSGQEINLK